MVRGFIIICLKEKQIKVVSFVLLASSSRKTSEVLHFARQRVIFSSSMAQRSGLRNEFSLPITLHKQLSPASYKIKQNKTQRNQTIDTEKEVRKNYRLHHVPRSPKK